MRNAYNGRYRQMHALARVQTRACTEKQRACGHACAPVCTCVCTEYACPGADVSAQTEPGDNGYQQWIYRQTCVGVLGYRY